MPFFVDFKLTCSVVLKYTRRMDDQYRTHNIRFRPGQLEEIRSVAERVGLSLQDIVRLSVGLGLPQVASKFATQPSEVEEATK